MTSPLAPLVDDETFIGVFPRDLTASELGRLAYLLNSASNSVRGFCRRDFTVETTTLRIKPFGDQVKLPNPPITAVESVSRVNFDGSTTGLAGWAWDGGQTVYVWATGSPMINAPEWWADDYYTPFIEVVYTHGDDVIPSEAQDVVISMIARVLDAPTNVEGTRSETTGPFAVSTATPGGFPGITPKLSDDDKQRLRDAGLTPGRAYTTVQLG